MNGAVAPSVEDDRKGLPSLRRRLAEFCARLPGSKPNGLPRAVLSVGRFRAAPNSARRRRQNIGKPFAIVLDGKVITAPVIQTAITGGSLITGNSRRSGDRSRCAAPPAPCPPLRHPRERPSAPISAPIDQAGTTLVRRVGLVIRSWWCSTGCSGSLRTLRVLQPRHMVASLSNLGATLTLPGIAGIALTWAWRSRHVLIYERIREGSQRALDLSRSMPGSARLRAPSSSHVTTRSRARSLRAGSARSRASR